mmetsp:Transcript_18052/g.39673  ORF Transcript_18052/g.39673 Transcript_18052/m.39673 type:complete len:229 (+) Transcript_18052:213-899(+)
MTTSARRRCSASGTCFARIASNSASTMPDRSRTRLRWICAGALATATTSQRRSWPLSMSSGSSRTTSSSPRLTASRMNSSRRWSTSGKTTSSSTLLRLSAFASPAANSDSAGRLMPPSSPMTSSPKSCRTGSTAAPPFAYSSRTTASASLTAMPSSRNMAETVLLPMPTLPVSPRTMVSPRTLSSLRGKPMTPMTPCEAIPPPLGFYPRRASSQWDWLIVGLELLVES